MSDIPIEKQEYGTEPHVKSVALINGDSAGKAMPAKTDKWWGYELTYKNDGQYCCKLLHFEPGGYTSMHFHVGKHETLVVTKGVLTLEYTVDKKTYVRKLPEGIAWVVCPGFVHKLSAQDGVVEVLEASTADFEDDSIRIS